MRESSCGKSRTFESSRARQLLCAVGVPEGRRWGAAKRTCGRG